MDEEEEAVGESGSYLLAGRVVPRAEVASHLRAAGFPENMIGKMTCVAKWESSFFERASNRNRRSTDRGLFQINSVHLGGTRGCPSSAEALFDARTNTRCAFAVFQAQGINAWVAYRKHKRECDAARAPDDAAPSSTSPDDEPSSDDDATTSSDSNDNGGGCFSATLDEMRPQGSCVQSAASSSPGVWFQCKNGLWYRGGDAASGPHGTCTASSPLQ